MSSPLVSIAISTYNRKDAVTRSVKSALGQTYSNCEILVVDDASTDKTKETLLSLFGKDPRFKYFQMPEQKGSTVARNFGLDKALGEYIIVWDSDDLLYPEAVELLMVFFNKYPGAVTVSAPARVWAGKKEIFFSRIPEGFILPGSFLCAKLPKYKLVRMVSRNKGGHIRYQGQNLDFIMNTKLVCAGDWYHHDRFLGDYVVSTDPVSLTQNRRRVDAKKSIKRARVLKRYLDEYGNKISSICPLHYAALAYGTAVGLLLDKKYEEGRKYAAYAFHYAKNNFKYRLFYQLSKLPHASLGLRFLFFIKKHVWRSA